MRRRAVCGDTCFGPGCERIHGDSACAAIAGLLVEHLLTDDLVIQGVIGTAAVARDSADPPPLSQTQFIKGVIEWA